MRVERRRLSRLAIGDELDAEDQPPAADVSDEARGALDRPQPVEQPLPHSRSVLDEPLVTNHVEGREARRARAAATHRA